MEREVASANWPVGLQYAVTADQSESINADLSMLRTPRGRLCWALH